MSETFFQRLRDELHLKEPPPQNCPPFTATYSPGFPFWKRRA